MRYVYLVSPAGSNFATFPELPRVGDKVVSHPPPSSPAGSPDVVYAVVDAWVYPQGYANHAGVDVDGQVVVAALADVPPAAPPS